MENKELKNFVPAELNDAQLESVSGGVGEDSIRVTDIIMANPSDYEKETKWQPPGADDFCEDEVISIPSYEDPKLILKKDSEQDLDLIRITKK